MRKTIAALTIAALTLAGAPSASAFSFGSSGSSFLESSTPATPEEQIRKAIEDSLDHAGYEIAHDLTPHAQTSLKSNDPREVDRADSVIAAAGLTRGQGGGMYTNLEAIQEMFKPTGPREPRNGLKAVVGVDYGIFTTRYMIHMHPYS